MDAAQPSSGQLVAGYKVLRRIMSDPRGDIFIATPDTAPRFADRVILRIMPFSMFESEVSVRDYMRRASLYATLSHSSIVQAYELCTDQNAVVLVLEQVDGLALDDLRASLDMLGEELSDEVAFYIGLRVVGALTAAHAARDPGDGGLSPIVHGNVRPECVLVPWDGYVRLAEFEVARVSAVWRGVEAASRPTPSRYMAPEQVHSGLASVKTDIYSAALMLWELLTKMVAIPPSLSGSSLARAMAKPRFPPLERVRPDLSPRFLAVMERALSPAAQRTVSASELLATLRDMVEPDKAEAKLLHLLERVRSGPTLRASVSQLVAPVTAEQAAELEQEATQVGEGDIELLDAQEATQAEPPPPPSRPSGRMAAAPPLPPRPASTPKLPAARSATPAAGTPTTPPAAATPGAGIVAPAPKIGAPRAPSASSSSLKSTTLGLAPPAVAPRPSAPRAVPRPGSSASLEAAAADSAPISPGASKSPSQIDAKERAVEPSSPQLPAPAAPFTTEPPLVASTLPEGVAPVALPPPAAAEAPELPRPEPLVNQTLPLVERSKSEPPPLAAQPILTVPAAEPAPAPADDAAKPPTADVAPATPTPAPTVAAPVAAPFSPETQKDLFGLSPQPAKAAAKSVPPPLDVDLENVVPPSEVGHPSRSWLTVLLFAMGAVAGVVFVFVGYRQWLAPKAGARATKPPAQVTAASTPAAVTPPPSAEPSAPSAPAVSAAPAQSASVVASAAEPASPPAAPEKPAVEPTPPAAVPDKPVAEPPSPPAAPEKPATAAVDTSDLDARTGLLDASGASRGRRVWVDGKVVGQTPDIFKVRCGTREVKIGSSGSERPIDVPCRGSVSVR